MHKKISITVITAVLTFISVSAVFGSDGMAQYDFAYELFMNNNFSMSEKIFDVFKAEYPDSKLAGNAEFLKGETLYNSGQYAGALESYTAIIEKHPKMKNKFKKELYFRMAECYFKLKDYNMSARYSFLVIENFSGSYLSKDAMLLAGENLYLAERFDEAIAVLMKLEAYPDYKYFDYVYYIMGRIYYEKAITALDGRSENAKESIRYFNRVKTEYPDSKIINHSEFRRANVYYLTEKYRTAVKIVDNIIAKESDEKFRLLMKYFIAWNYYMMGQYEKAVNYYDAIISENTKDMLAMWSEYKKGLCFESMGEKKKALEQFDRVSLEYPKTIPSAFSKYAIAYSLCKDKKYYESIDAFNEIIDEFGVEELERASYYMIADIYTILGKFFKAKDIYEVIGKEFAEDIYTAKYLQAWCLHKEREFTESGKILDSLMANSDVPEDIRIKSLIKSGDNYYELEMDKEAEEKYDEAIKESKRYPDITYEAMYAKGWIYYRKNDLNSAGKIFNKVKKIAPSASMRLRADFMLANTLYSNKDYKKALVKYLSLMENKEATENVRNESEFYAGWCYYRMEKFDIAVGFWNNYINKTSDRVKKAEAYYRIGWAFFRQNNFDEAIKNFVIVTEKYKDTHFYPEALLKTGDSKYNKKDYSGAIESYKKLVDETPDHYRIPEALYGIQWSYYQLGEHEKAIELSKEFLEKYKGSSFAPEIQYRIAEHYYNAGKLETAVEEFRKFFMKNQEHDLADNALYFMGTADLKLRKYNVSVNDFKTLLDKFPDSNFVERTVFKIANAYFKLHEYDNAINFYKRYSDTYKESQYLDEAYFNIALSYKKLGNIEESTQWYTKLISEIPKSSMAERAGMNLAYIYQDSKDYDKAIAAFREITEKKGKKAVEAQFWIADIYAGQKKNSDAIREYLKVYTDYPQEEIWAVSALDAAGRLYEKDGKLKSAISTYKKVLKATKQKKYTDVASKKIELLQEQYRLLHPVDETKGPVKQNSGVKK